MNDTDNEPSLFEQYAQDIEALRHHNGAFEGSLSETQKQALGRLIRGGKATLEPSDVNPFGPGAVIRLDPKILADDYDPVEAIIRKRVFRIMLWSIPVQIAGVAIIVAIAYLISGP